eukprot:maker-scaffold1362_size45580-snap-gene-0.14 protein:Tk10795 transcript:maker-scaffold1362_size45580-snap-gene-0.14-mRNA-1 annotation:"activating molecule in becn1-regulated autophagy protein 1"
MQRICRESLSGAIPRQRRQIIRLQSIRKMLEDLQVQIRSLRAASYQELQRREQERLNTDLISLAKYRTNQALTRLGSATRRAGASNRCPRVPGHTQGPSSRYPAVGPLRKSQNRSALLRARAQCQAASQMRASLRAFELSPDLARQGKSPISQVKAQASLDVLEQTSPPPVARPTQSPKIKPAVKPLLLHEPPPLLLPVAQDTRTELRALSQRLERLLRSQRENTDRGNFQPLEAQPEEPYPDLPPAIPRPSARLSYRQRVRHLLEGTTEYDTIVDETQSPAADPFASTSDSDGNEGEEEPFEEPGFTRHNGLGAGRRLHPPPPEASLRRSGHQPRHMRSLIREWNDSVARVRRDAERERRRRVSRDPDILRRRRRYGRHLGDPDLSASLLALDRSSPLSRPEHGSVPPEGPAPTSFNTVSPLREQIWRRLRRRNAQLNQLDSQILAETGSRERSRHREMLSWMVDQLSIDQPQLVHMVPEGEVRSSANEAIPTANNDSLSLAMSSSGHNPDPTSAGGAASARGRSFFNHPLRHRHYQYFERRDPLLMAPFSLRSIDGIESGQMLAVNRVQAWDFVRGNIPDIADTTANVVVKEANIVGAASVDISENGAILVTLSPSSVPMTTVVGVYSLKPETRGQCYATLSLESSVVSVSLSPTSRHLLVGLNRHNRHRMPFNPNERGTMAHVFRIQLPWERGAERGRLIHKRDIPHVEQSSLNCIRWIPLPGQGIAYATNTGLLKILR